ncbi:MAG TPA: methyltransferase [Elusimicrobiales bacterium]|nr:methyltransferase [Elusimicrobiales bacterium]
MKQDINAVTDLIFGYRRAKILIEAASLNIFTLIEKSSTTSKNISDTLNIDPRATEAILNALVAMGFLYKKNGRYRNTAVSKKFLVEGKPACRVRNLTYQNIIWDAWSGLGNVLKNGRPSTLLPKLLKDSKFLKSYIVGMREFAKKPSKEVAQAIDTSNVLRMLDVGGGPGSYTTAFLKKNPALKGVILDLPQTLKIAKEFISKSSVKNRVNFIPGDYHKVSFGSNKFDLVLFSHVTHDEGYQENKKLFKKAYRALRKNGLIVIHDFMLDKSFTSPLIPALFFVHMVVHTEKGRVYSNIEYKKLLKSTGFCFKEEKIICPSAATSSKIIIARKK